MLNQPQHQWSFLRLGGLDQVILQSAEDFLRLRELDPKIWVALSCPASGLEFDAGTLAIMDTDKDGRIRRPEVLNAVEWACSLLKDPACLKDGNDFLPLEAVRDDTEAGRRIAATIKTVLINLGKPDEQGLTQADMEKALYDAAGHIFNGDGVIPPLDGIEDDVRAFIEDVMHVIGGVKDAGGRFGITGGLAAAFMRLLRDRKNWEAEVEKAAAPLGSDAAGAWQCLQSVRTKIDDYFLRAELAAYAPQTQPALNIAENFVAPQQNGLLSLPALSDLPLAQAGPDKPLGLATGLNPEWRARVECFARAVRDLLKNPEELSRENWLEIQNVFAPYADVLDKKPGRPDISTDLAPDGDLYSLTPERVDELLLGAARAKFDRLAEEDAQRPASATDIAEADKLVRYHRHLYRLLMNFVSFHDFYGSSQKAAFQIGTLYIDGKSCELCLPVPDIATHTALAEFSNLFLVYCKCTRKQTPGGAAAPENKNIVAAVTAGSPDLLIEKRNAVFVDAKGDDWDAAVIKVSPNPISIRQAWGDPYRRFGRMISEQLHKLAGNKDAELASAIGKQIDATAAAAQPETGAVAPKFDIGRNVGIFAAVGLALGAIGTALGSLAAALFSLAWWQFPVLILGLFLLISGPSVVMAWLKLRKRTLGPLLEASGWAVNGKIFINFFLGAQLTATASLPPGASRSYADPYGKGGKGAGLAFGLCLLAGAAAALWLWHGGYLKGLLGGE